MTSDVVTKLSSMRARWTSEFPRNSTIHPSGRLRTCRLLLRCRIDVSIKSGHRPLAAIGPNLISSAAGFWKILWAKICDWPTNFTRASLVAWIDFSTATSGIKSLPSRWESDKSVRVPRHEKIRRNVAKNNVIYKETHCTGIE